MRGAPKYVIWIFTAACNLDCLHCYAKRFRGLPELPLGEKLRIARDLGESGVEYVNLTGGEPLIHPHLEHILGELSERGVETSVVTNATAVSDRAASLLGRTGTYAYVSIEGPREVHDKIRGEGTFERAMAGLRKLLGSALGVSVVTTVNKLNADRIEEAVDVVADLGVEEMAVIPVMPSGRAAETKIYVGPEEYARALVAAHRKARERGIRLSTWCTPWAPLLIGDLEGGSFCRAMVGFDVDPAGDVLLCDVLDFRITTLRGKGVREAFTEFRQHWLVRAVMEPGFLPRWCASCPLRASCAGGCFARAYLARGGLNAGDPLCPRAANVRAAP
ncbi:MAG: radical SAM protein [Desulfurococcaceae archaeon]